MSAVAVPLDRTVFCRPIAHRGLFGGAVPENSAAAFAGAIAAGYGIECDLRAAWGGEPAVFHDETLKRLTGEAGRVADVHLGTPAAPCLRDGTPIPRFADLLQQTGGRVPLLVEVKSEWTPVDQAFIAAIARDAATYRGPLALMSFDPAIIAALAKAAPGVPRGLVSGSYRGGDGDDWWARQLPAERAASLRAMTDFDTLGATFAAYEVAALPTRETAAIRARGYPVFAWTVRTPAQHTIVRRHADAAIFEGDPA